MAAAAVAPAGAGHRYAQAAVLLAVVVLHLVVMREVGQGMLDFSAQSQMPPRIEVVYARELEISQPPAVAPLAPLPVAAAPLPARQVTPVEPAASQPLPRPEAKAQLPEPAASVVAQADPAPTEPWLPPVVEASPPSVLSDLAPAPIAAPPAAASEPAAEPFAWPASTRIRYTLTGNYRGDVTGDAQVEWVRQDSRYQVHLDVTVGPSFSPIYTRRMSSQGQLTEGGLYPERYDEDSKLAFRDRRIAHLNFEADEVVLRNGNRLPRTPGMQDSASQFVQMSYLFSRQPQLLKPGGVIEMPLVLPKRQSVWLYDVRDTELIQTPFGELEAVRLQPRRESRKGDDLTAEVWFAPSLRYLPVRIRIQKDEESYLDLLIERKPQLAK
jgi:hypothetical protein